MHTLPTLLCCWLTVAAASAQSDPVSTLHTEELVVQGRFVDADSGAPLSRCEVRLSGHQGTGYSLAWSAGDWCDPEPITTGADGRFHFVLRVPAADRLPDDNRYHIDTSHPMHLPWFSHCAFEVAQKLGTIDYGDIRLPAGVRPRIRCVDRNGKLQPGVRLTLRAQDREKWPADTPELGPHSWITGGTVGLTDIDGYLHLADPVRAGAWTLQVEGRTAVTPDMTFTLPSRDAIDVVVEALPARGAIVGRIVDDRGDPVARAMLSTKGSASGSCRSLRDGRFVLLRADDQQDDTAVVSMARNSRYDRWAQVATLGWGEENAVITIPAAVPVSFEVTTSAGAPCEAFNLYCLPLDEQAAAEPLRLAGTFAKGHVEADLAPGDYKVLVYPRTAGAVPGEWVQVTVASPQEPIRLQVPVPVARAVQVTCDGKPVEDAFVEVITGNEPQDDFVRPLSATVNPLRLVDSLCVASARTTATGTAALAVPPDAEGAWLRISGRQIQTKVVHVPAWPGAAVEVAVAAGAVLTGSITPVDALFALDPDDARERARKSIYSYQRRFAPRLIVEAGGAHEARVDLHGHFEITGLPPGVARVRLGRWTKNGNSYHREETLLDLGTFELTPGPPTEVKLQVPAELLPK
ncbi:MAG: hypothetical protein H6838_05585 [Planctomycetes bacterium]|nr:hypothetical protein [Planctomycetota bacterium]MCB9884943.1 hypothetical protein [Planctomycetota bacterium]